jgi:hypothetical protein
MANRTLQLENIQSKAKNLFIKKNKDYGDAFAEYGTIGVLVRIGDKIKRAQSITSKGINLVDDEGIKDTLLDLHNYAAMALMLIEENENSDNDSEPVLESNDECPINIQTWTIKGINGVYIRKKFICPKTQKLKETCSCQSFYYCKDENKTCKHILNPDLFR